MSTSTSAIPSHRHTRSAAFVPPLAAPQNPQNPHHLNQQSYNTNSQPGTIYPPQPTTPPRTPQKPGYNTIAKNENGAESASKPRSKGKNRPKNVMTSPAASRHDRSTPPLTGMQPAGSTTARPISTPSTAAYAGPTFHASPAPSALPIPSFYSKSVPESPGMKVLKAQRDSTLSSTGDLPTPSTTQILAEQTKREASPLDFFFKADREEKARARSSSSFRGSSMENGPFQPPVESPHSGQTTPAPGGQQRSGHSHFAGGSSSAMFAMELDGNSSPGQPYGPAFSTPYNERINAARAGSSPLQSPPTPNEQQQATDRSEALKAYLFSGKVKSPAAPAGDAPNFLDSPLSITPGSGTLSRNTSGTLGGLQKGMPARASHNSYPNVNDSFPSQNSPRGNSRVSGLRQEVTPTKTPIPTPERLAGVFTDAPTPSRESRNDPSPTSRKHGPAFVAAGSNSPNTVPLSGSSGGAKNADLRGMEDSLRRILKLEPLCDPEPQAPGSNIHNGVLR